MINFNKPCETSLKLMFYGTKAALGILLIGISAYFYNKLYLGGLYNNTIFCLCIIQASFSLFVQFIIGGLILDCVNKGKNGN